MTTKGTPQQVLRTVFTDDPPPVGGSCAETDPEVFYPEKGGTSRPAQAICRGCPIVAECLEWALRTEERFGVWGGMSARERKSIFAHRKLVSREQAG